MKLTATPAEVSLRSTIPITTVLIHTTIPVGANEVGRCQPRESSQPTTVPVKNGQAVSATPVTVMPSAWLRRPIVQNTTTQIRSARKAVPLARRICHHIQYQGADVGLVALGEARLPCGRLAVEQRIGGGQRGEPRIEPERFEGKW